MYTGLACLILFDARGGVDPLLPVTVYIAAVLLLSGLLLCMAYFPHIFHRPELVDSFCADVLMVTVHAACIGMVSDPLLRHACALHSACYCIQNRFLGGAKTTVQPVLVHTILALLLLAAYVYGPRITEIRQFMIAAVCPHVLDLGAKLLANVHEGLVTFWLEKGT